MDLFRLSGVSTSVPEASTTGAAAPPVVVLAVGDPSGCGAPWSTALRWRPHFSAIEGLLGGADITYQVTDRNMSVLEGSIIAIQMRILVPDDHEAEARELLVDAELGNWLRP